MGREENIFPRTLDLRHMEHFLCKLHCNILPKSTVPSNPALVSALYNHVSLTSASMTGCNESLCNSSN